MCKYNRWVCWHCFSVLPCVQKTNSKMPLKISLPTKEHTFSTTILQGLLLLVLDSLWKCLAYFGLPEVLGTVRMQNWAPCLIISWVEIQPRRDGLSSFGANLSSGGSICPKIAGSDEKPRKSTKSRHRYFTTSVTTEQFRTSGDCLGCIGDDELPSYVGIIL